MHVQIRRRYFGTIIALVSGCLPGVEGGGEMEGVEENKGVRKRMGCIVLCSQHPRTLSVLVACASATSSPSSC